MINHYDITILLLMMSPIPSELQNTLETMSKIQQEKDSLSMRTQHLEANLQVSEEGREGGREGERRERGGSNHLLSGG